MIQITGKGYENLAMYEMETTKTTGGAAVTISSSKGKHRVEDLLKEIGDVTIAVQSTIYIDDELLSSAVIKIIQGSRDKNLELFVGRLVSAAIEDPTNWKHAAVKAYETTDEGIAMFLAYQITMYHGGALIIKQDKKPPYKPVYFVYTFGYNHYIGP